MPVEESYFAETYSKVSVSQTTNIPVPPVGMRREPEEELLVVAVEFCKPYVFQPTLSGPIYIQIGTKHCLKMHFVFSEVKQTCKESNFREMMKYDLTDVGVREDLQEEMFGKLFPVIYAAETYEVPIHVTINDITAFWPDGDEDSRFTSDPQIICLDSD